MEWSHHEKVFSGWSGGGLWSRIPFRLTPDVQIGPRTLTMHTESVGLGGAFLTTDEPPAPYQLLRLNLDLPTESLRVRLRGVVVQTVTMIEAVHRGISPGIEIQFYGLSESTCRRWHRFVEWVQPIDEISSAWAPPPPFFYRISPRTFEDLARFLFRGLMHKGIVLVDLPSEAHSVTAVVSVVHPDTGAEFHVPGTATSDKTCSSSTIVHFLGVTKRTVEGFEYFMNHGSPPSFEHAPTRAPEEMVIYEGVGETQDNIKFLAPRFAMVKTFRSIARDEQVDAHKS